MGPHVLKDLIEPGTSQGTHPLNPWQAPEPMITTHLKRDNERKMGVGGLGQPTESADASNLYTIFLPYYQIEHQSQNPQSVSKHSLV